MFPSCFPDASIKHPETSAKSAFQVGEDIYISDFFISPFFKYKFSRGKLIDKTGKLAWNGNCLPRSVYLEFKRESSSERQY